VNESWMARPAFHKLALTAAAAE